MDKAKIEKMWERCNELTKRGYEWDKGGITEKERGFLIRLSRALDRNRGMYSYEKQDANGYWSAVDTPLPLPR